MSVEMLGCAPRLDGWTAIVTGAGRGVGFETARHLAMLGAAVVVAELDPVTGTAAAEAISAEVGAGSARFVRTDVADPESLSSLVRAVDPIDVVINNATITPMGAVPEVPLEHWDASYQVNLRGPVVLARLTVPGMVERGRGVFVALSSVGGAYMAPYESFKSAQVEMASALAQELEDTGVFAFAIGPGQVETPGLQAGVEQLAPLYGMSVEEFKALNADHLISAEEAGAGIAVAVACAERFHGTEISSLAALAAVRPEAVAPPVRPSFDSARKERFGAIADTLAEQVAGWRERNVFERKWMERDFRKVAGRTPDEMLADLRAGESSALDALEAYYAHYEELARGNVRDSEALAKALEDMAEWRREIQAARSE